MQGANSADAVPSGRWSTVTRERFEQMVADALDAIPPTLGDGDGQRRGGRRGVADARAARAVAHGRTLLGLYEGVPLTAARPAELRGRRARPDHDLPRPAVAGSPTTRTTSRAASASTVLHEVGHYFGMTDDRLRELGWA